jgi:Trypsin
VRLGEWDTSSDVDCEYIDGDRICSNAAVDIPIEKQIIHEQYDPEASNKHNDIALLRLAADAPYTEFIRPICLPFASELRSNDFVDQTLSVAGWGKRST